MIYPFYKTCPDFFGISRKGYRSGCHCHYCILQLIKLFFLFLTRIYMFIRGHTHALCTRTPIHDYKHFRRMKFSLTTLIKYIPKYADFDILYILPHFSPLESVCQLPISNVKSNLNVLKKQQMETVAL